MFKLQPDFLGIVLLGNILHLPSSPSKLPTLKKFITRHLYQASFYLQFVIVNMVVNILNDLIRIVEKRISNSEHFLVLILFFCLFDTFVTMYKKVWISPQEAHLQNLLLNVADLEKIGQEQTETSDHGYIINQSSNITKGTQFYK